MSMLDRFRLDGRVALVTGGGRGIGAATARALADAGAIVVVTDADGDAAGAVAAELELGEGHAMDITSDEGVAAVFASVADRHGRLDILVNNAGRGARMPAVDMSLDTWEQVMAVNLTGSFRCAQAAAQLMQTGDGAPVGGSVINVASIMGLVGGGLYPNAAYQTSKGGVVNMTRTLALEWAPDNIRVNAVAPTFARTALTEKLLSDGEMERAIVDNTPMGRLAEPEEVASAILFLAGDGASMITGAILPVDGGWTAR